MALAAGLERLPLLADLIKQGQSEAKNHAEPLLALQQPRPDLQELAALLQHQLIETPPLSLTEGGVINDFVVKTLVNNGGISNRPLHDLAMGQEHVRLGTALYVLKRLRCPVYELKTDSILFRSTKRAKVAVGALS